jgi:hypothetical protein
MPLIEKHAYVRLLKSMEMPTSHIMSLLGPPHIRLRRLGPTPMTVFLFLIDRRQVPISLPSIIYLETPR